MFKTSKTASAVRYVMAFGAASVAMSSFAFAQEAQKADEAKKVERIEVTGSRIKRADIETASPITVLGKADIDASGFQNVGDLLRNISQADVGGLTQLTNNTNGNDGSQTLSLRGLGASRALILVDGRRWLALGGGQVDISQIPLAVIESIDVMADGASAIYGSDAIAGVVNIKTRKDYEGLELDITKGANFEGDGQVTTAGITIGSVQGKTSTFFNVSKTEQDPIMAGDRDISKYPVVGVPQAYGSAYGLFGRFSVPGRGTVALKPEREGVAGPRTPDDFEPFSNKHRYNYAPTNYLLTPSNRLNVFAKATHEFNDNLRGFAQVTFNQRKSVTQLAEVPLTMGSSGPQWAIPIAANNIYNPFGVQINTSGFRTTPVGPRIYNQDYDTYFMTSGVEGDFELNDRTYSWDISMSRGESSRNSTGENFINLQKLRNALGSSFIDSQGLAKCGTPTAVITGCVPLNLFNGVTGFTQEMADYISYSLVQSEKLGNQDFTANIGGELFDLPAGPVGLAVGVQYRTNTYVDSPDAVIAAGQSSSNFREPTNGSQEAKEKYFELSVPVLADMPLVQSFELSLAGRSSDFTNSGYVGKTFSATEFDNSSYKVGFTWRVNEELMIRGNFTDTFRAPSVTDLYSGGAEGFPSATDPCTKSFPSSVPGGSYSQLNDAEKARCHAQGVPVGGSVQPTTQLRSLSGGNPYLKPESGDTKTIGIVYNPEWLDGFDMTLDWWKIYLEDRLSSLGTSTILNQCIRDNNNRPEYCGFIERDSAGNIETVRTAQFNMSKSEVSGVDANFNYNTDIGEFGRLSFRLNSTYMLTDKGTSNEGSLADATNNVGQWDTEIYRLRSNLSTTWEYGDFTTTWSIRHLGKLTEGCYGAESLYDAGLAEFQICNHPDAEEPYNTIGTTFYHDASVAYATPWNSTVRVVLRNVFRKEPPISLNSFANSFIQTYDIPGGTWAIQYVQKF